MDSGKWTGETDSDLNVRRIILFMAGMAAAIALCTAIVFMFGGVLTKSLVARDPKPSPIKVAPSEKAPGRGPLLQKSPAADMRQMNREQDEILSSYAWADRPAGIARIPIQRAIELASVPSVASALVPAPAPGKADEKPGTRPGARERPALSEGTKP